MKEIYYYLRDALARPVVTVCLLEADDDIFIRKNGKSSIMLTGLARGISICSLEDTTNKKKGRIMAKGRALKALIRKESGARIQRQEAAEVLGATLSLPLFLGLGKYDFDPILNDLEMKLMGSG